MLLRLLAAALLLAPPPALAAAARAYAPARSISRASVRAYLDNGAGRTLLETLDLGDFTSPSQLDAVADILDGAGLDVVALMGGRTEGIRAKVETFASSFGSADGAHLEALAVLAPEQARRLAGAAAATETRIAEAGAWGAADAGLFPGAGATAPLGRSGPAAGLAPARSLKSLWEEHEAAGAPPFQNIVIDARGSRGGNGDVAAGYLVATDILARAKRAGASARITFIIDEKSEEILSNLRGRAVKPGLVDFEGQVAFHDLKTLPADFPAADLYMALASPNSSLRFADSLRYDGEGSRSEDGVPINRRTVLLAQTVLGNTENGRYSDPYGSLTIGYRTMSLQAAGLADDESGLYSDQVAWSLRGKPRAKVREFLKEHLSWLKSPRDRRVIDGLLDGRYLKGVEPGLVYGIRAPSQKHHFETYLLGIAENALKTGKSYALVSPLEFALSDIKNEKLRKRVIIVEAGATPPGKPKPGMIYVVRTGPLPHPIFVGLIAYAGPPALIAGDGAISAGVILGKPFVMTRVDWNASNIANLRKKLIAAGKDIPGAAGLFSQVYNDASPDLTRTQELAKLAPLYEGLVRSFKGLTSSMLDSAAAVSRATRDKTPAKELLADLPADWILRMDFLLNRHMMGDKDALALFGLEFLKVPAKRRARILAKAENVLGADVAVGPDGVVRVTPAREFKGTARDAMDPDKVGVSGRLVALRGGRFRMGSPSDEADRGPEERQRDVRVGAFAIAAGPVTQRQFMLVLGRNPSRFKGKGDSDDDFRRVNGKLMNVNHPVEQVTWFDAVEYCNALSKAEGLKPAYRVSNVVRDADGRIVRADVSLAGGSVRNVEGYRLPTEAEWEYAARGGEAGPRWFREGGAWANARLWFGGNAGGRTHAVRDWAHANQYGLFDMLGNVFEWTQDGGKTRVVRGGSYASDPARLRSAARAHSAPPGSMGYEVGFRPVRSILN